ncbi:Uu.00g040070.m01.CDS01 [Anthostomella pinea]|uniref:Uu.00g040070.m01.CDS01 n=1 Tax=Anthostomella pinea TaxID=933095 RepID=A0AAI8VA42_9PEZI|nr:Uu.00g040070.m01.CDS01 [Anthostomella pinea]
MAGIEIETSYIPELQKHFDEYGVPLAAPASRTVRCAICAEDLAVFWHANEHHHAWTYLPCGHIFGYECLRSWFKPSAGGPNPGCPSCRKKMAHRGCGHLVDMEPRQAGDGFNIRSDVAPLLAPGEQLPPRCKASCKPLAAEAGSRWIGVNRMLYPWNPYSPNPPSQTSHRDRNTYSAQHSAWDDLPLPNTSHHGPNPYPAQDPLRTSVSYPPPQTPRSGPWDMLQRLSPPQASLHDGVSHPPHPSPPQIAESTPTLRPSTGSSNRDRPESLAAGNVAPEDNILPSFRLLRLLDELDQTARDLDAYRNRPPTPPSPLAAAHSEAPPSGGGHDSPTTVASPATTGPVPRHSIAEESD